jgi:hypothetical protein
VTASSLLAEPAFCHIPPYRVTLGPEVADLCREAEFGPDPDQERILDAIFARSAGGLSAAFEVAVICARQNLKTAVFKQAALGWLFLTEERLVVWSSHEFPTAAEAFRDLDELVTGCDELRRQVRYIYRGNGEESIETLAGARLIFRTRTKGGGRGLSGRKVILDEGMALRPMHMGALLPTLSAQPDPQVLYGASAGWAESDVLRGVRDRGRAGADDRLAWIEYCAPPPEKACAAGDACTHALNAPGCGCDDPAYWQLANPALGRRITGEYIAAERRALPPAEFGRERMGWWDDPADGGIPIDLAAWNDCADPASRMTGRVALAVAVAPDATSAAIAVAGRRVDGLAHGELTEPPRRGTAGLVARLLELAEAWDPCVLVINPSGAAGALEAELLEHGFGPWKRVVDLPTGRWTEVNVNARPLLATSVREYAQACGALAQDVSNGRWRHLGQQPVDAAVAGARTRPLADAWAWSWKHSLADISPLEAITLARHGYATFGVQAPPPPDVF